MKNSGNNSLRTLLLMLASSRTTILIVVKWNPHGLSWSSQTVFEADQLLHSWIRFLLQAWTKTNGCRSSYGHSPLGANVRVGHTSFIHDDGRHFASSRAISESIKKAINLERTKRKKNVGTINHRDRLPDADKSLTYWQHLSALYPNSLSRLQQNPFFSHGCC